MCPLQVDTFAGSIGCNQDAHASVLLEQLFHLAPLLTEHSTMDRNNSRLISDKGSDFSCKVIQRVLMLRENNQLFTLTIFGKHGFFVLKQTGKLVPFAVNTADSDGIRHLFQPL